MQDFNDFKEKNKADLNDMGKIHADILATALERAVRSSAENGDAEAQFELGCNYDAGDGVEKDPAKAVYWYRKAAEQGHARAQFNLACSYANGEGVEADQYQASYWFRKAAEGGFVKAQFNYGVRCANGTGVTMDPAEAVQWYRKAVEQGDVSAKNNLGLCYIDGTGVAKDITRGALLIKEAAEAGDAQAQYNLGVRYFEGEGLGRDYAKAAEWFEKAVRQNVSGAAEALEQARRMQKQAEENKRKALEEEERRRRQEEADRHDISMEIGAIIALLITLAGTPLYIWVTDHRSGLFFLVILLVQALSLAAGGIGGCVGLALFGASFTEILGIPCGIAGLIGGLTPIFCYEDPTVYQKARLIVFVLVGVMVLRIIFKKVRK